MRFSLSTGFCVAIENGDAGTCTDVLEEYELSNKATRGSCLAILDDFDTRSKRMRVCQYADTVFESVRYDIAASAAASLASDEDSANCPTNGSCRCMKYTSLEEENGKKS